LEYQIEKLLRAGQAPAADATAEEAGKEDALSFRPNPDMLVSKLDQMAEVGITVLFSPWIGSWKFTVAGVHKLGYVSIASEKV